jgi:phospholipase C
MPVLADDRATTTPIKHVVVIFFENISFDHYFGTYPTALNPPGEPRFVPRDETPAINNLASNNLLTNNPTSSSPSVSTGRKRSPATWTTTTPPSRRPSMAG